jgi:glycosyltransferase involved in cell wall biosynthesis
LKKVSVIIPCYNVDEYLERCWQSLVRQTIGLDEIECIFVNDASTDDGKTLSRICEIENRSPMNVMVINLEENVGPGEARNIALEYAGGKYIQFLDADDELDDDALRLLYETAEENDADVIQFNHLYILGDQQKSSRNSKEDKLYEFKTRGDRLPFLIGDMVSYGCTNKFMRFDLILEADVRFPARVKYEEPLFIYPLFLYAKRVYLLNRELYYYRFRPGSTVTSQLGKKLLDHPKVQLLLLEYCLKRPVLYEEYKDAFEFYFLWSFYLETICFAGRSSEAYLPLGYFEYMQLVCTRYFADWKENYMVKQLPERAKNALESMYTKFEDQEQLNAFLDKEKDCI